MTSLADPTFIPALAHREIGHYEQRGLISLTVASQLLQHLRQAIAVGDRARSAEIAAAAGWLAEEHLAYALQGCAHIADGVTDSANIAVGRVLAALGPVEPLGEAAQGRHTGPMPVVSAEQGR